MATSQPSRPWVLAGGLSFACLEIVGLAYAYGVGRVQFSHQTLLGAVTATVMMGVFGLLVGLVFAKTHGLFGLLNIYAQGVLALVVMNAVSFIFTRGVSSVDPAAGQRTRMRGW